MSAKIQKNIETNKYFPRFIWSLMFFFLIFANGIKMYVSDLAMAFEKLIWQYRFLTPSIPTVRPTSILTSIWKPNGVNG